MEKKEFYIQVLELKNYRKYDEKNFTFNKQFNLLVGENAAGKTTVLEGIATSIGGYLQCFKGILASETHGVKTKDVRVQYRKSENGITVNQKLPVEVSGKFKIDGRDISIKRVKKNLKQGATLGKKENSEIFSIVGNIENHISEEKEVILPIFSYHGTGRLWEQEHKNSSKMENLRRIDGYRDALNPKSNYSNFISWFEKLERHAFNMKQENSLLETVREVIGTTLEKLTGSEISKIIYRDGDLEFYYKKEHEAQRVGLLSDGYRNIIGLVSDIGYRMAILNPNLRNNIKVTPGVVLIDEIDLHLHPKWQKLVVDILRDLFPNVQFIATSHSPFIIQAMREGEIIGLDDNDRLLADGSEMSIEDISQEIMHVKNPQMSKRKLEMLNGI